MVLKLSNEYFSNQKEVIKNTVLNFLFKKDIHSMLDIGAGQPETVLVFRNAVNEYLAIEKNKKRAKRIKQEGVSIINKTFPCAIPNQFDLVLLSHSIPEKIIEYNSFLSSAWELVKSKGFLMVITFKGANDTIAKIKCALTDDCRLIDEEKYDLMMKILYSMGKPQLVKIKSFETTRFPNDLIKTICFSLNLKFNKQKNKILNILNTQYKEDEKYFLPHEHLVIILNKS